MLMMITVTMVTLIIGINKTDLKLFVIYFLVSKKKFPKKFLVKNKPAKKSF